MSLALMMLVQAAAPAPPAPPALPALATIDFDLARYRPADLDRWTLGPSCTRTDPTAIIVCGRRSHATYPLEEMARLFEPGRIVAETGIAGNLVGGVRVEGVELQPGVVSNRLLVGIRVPF
jgi:hypothetical protein